MNRDTCDRLRSVSMTSTREYYICSSSCHVGFLPLIYSFGSSHPSNHSMPILDLAQTVINLNMGLRVKPHTKLPQSLRLIQRVKRILTGRFFCERFSAQQIWLMQFRPCQYSTYQHNTFHSIASLCDKCRFGCASFFVFARTCVVRLYKYV
jgi:hypothetical protein